MGRRLPWNKTGPKAKTRSSPAQADVKTESRDAPITTSATKDRASSAAGISSPVPPRRQSRLLDSDPIRSPSTSPPPEAPQEQFMIAGPLDDDRYRMVEDEFLAVAQRFTTHLHRAEYSRLRQLAKSQNAATIREIERPVVGPPTRTARARSETVKRLARQRRLAGNELDGDERKSPFAGSSLKGLLERSRKDDGIVAPYAVAVSPPQTRAAAGYQSNVGAGGDKTRRQRLDHSPPPRKSARRAVAVDESTDEGDQGLPSPSPPPSRIPSIGASVRPSNRSPRTPRPTSPTIPGTSTRSWPISVRATSSPAQRDHAGNDKDHDHDIEDDDDPFGMSRRRIRREKSRQSLTSQPKKEETPRKTSVSTIPTFL